MAQTRNLGLSLLAAAQAQKHVTHNEALERLDALVHLSCLDKDLAAPPADPAEGDRHLVLDAAPSGAWSGFTGKIALREGGVWIGLMPQPGWRAYLEDEGETYLFTGTQWLPYRATLRILQNLEKLGIGTSADAANPFAAKLNAALWTALGTAEGGSGDLRCTLNKQGAGNVLSLLWQSAYSGRAELGLVGSDDLSLKVSPDGNVWYTAYTVARATGEVAFERGVLREELTVLTSSGNWTKPAWARSVTIVAMGGGGGGGSGRRGAAASVRTGGGGGGAGALVSETFSAGEIGEVLIVTIGTGGAGGSGQTTNDGNGLVGTAGAASYIREGVTYLVYAYGGAGGGAGATAAASGGSAGSGFSVEPVGAGGASAAAGGPGATGATGTTGAGGGGSGGGLTSANASSAGAVGGYGYMSGYTSRRSAPGAGGAAGFMGGSGADKAWMRGAGAGGGGGGSGDAGGPGGAGGQGGGPGGGGGGGGASLNGAVSGAGGQGARGEVWILCRG